MAAQRETTQRRAIRQALGEADRPLSPQEVLALAQRSAPGLGLATVYRTLRAMVEEGEIEPVSLPGEADRYEISGKHHHHHFRCRSCERVFDLAARCLPGLRSLLPAGFEMDEHELLLEGRCADCGDRGGGRGRVKPPRGRDG